MPTRFLITFCVIAFLFPLQGISQIIHGEVYDAENKSVIAGVVIENIYTSLNVTCDEKGTFVIAASNGQLLEFKKQGYKTTRVRIPNGYIPSYFKIGMQKGFHPLTDTVRHETRYNYKADSLAFHELFKHELDFPKMSAIEMIRSPFTAMSKRNQEMWKFQDEYNINEREKYVDFTFNKELVTKFTGLTGDSLNYYMKRYRPTYEQLRSMNDYSFFNFIKQSVRSYRHPQIQTTAQ